MTRARKKVPKRHPGGRPPKPPGEARTVAILLKLTPAEAARLDQLGDSRQDTRQDTLRRLIAEAPIPPR